MYEKKPKTISKNLAPTPPKDKTKRKNSIRNSQMFMSMGGGDGGDSDDENSGGKDKLSKAMIAQKEQGLRAIQIFKKFPHCISGRMSVSDFEKGLKKMRRNFGKGDVLELVGLLRVEAGEDVDEGREEAYAAGGGGGANNNKEDGSRPAEGTGNSQGGDGGADNAVYISSQKLCDFAFGLPAMPWKAEKKRLGYRGGGKDKMGFRLGEADVKEEVKDEKEEGEKGEKKDEEGSKEVDKFKEVRGGGGGEGGGWSKATATRKLTVL